ncbi:hypothetical protein D3C86_1989140 [compost metagenome]
MFEIQKDCAGFTVTGQEIQQFIDINIQAIAQRDEIRKSHLTLLRPVENGVGDSR